MDDRVALVTGAFRGIGRAISLRLAASGMRIAVNYLNADFEAEARGVLGEIEAAGSGGFIVEGDVSISEHANRLVAETVAKYGHLDVLVNNAGIARDTLAMRMSDDDWDVVLRIDLTGAFYCTRAALRPMVKQRYGRIVNISSIAGVGGNVGQANYSAAKAGLIGLTKSVAREVASRGITVNAVAPGLIETSMAAALSDEARTRILEQIPAGRLGLPEEVAHAVNFLASGEAGYITGQVLGINGGMLMA
ncbi:MAG: 3-oxoacyl-[acyl-carrier-protein] reductase [Chloroflexi bacterium]|nr:3-oxoacyl-[acyl-carrier-protein] reductase [Chloroflexota bacterium]